MIKPRWWLTFCLRDGLIFAAVLGVAVMMWYSLPPEVRVQLLQSRPRHWMDPIKIMFIAWLTGWFGLLFVRMEDLNVLAPINYQAGMRFVAALLIATAVIIAAFVLLAI